MEMVAAVCILGRAAPSARGESYHRGEVPTQERGGRRTEAEDERGRKEGDGGEEKSSSKRHQTF